ncbi:hypothetical protein PPERSA_05912 [Pseudocohnilembus persalinus]|uniref:Uncharacterized protein n=1 Tax=Pseudocohnilembus persalinus TaxID=266149 RepID=A0A0V0R428_PSEPJ|nr:hypothetical protein PPERSA_05912 [Pseudocohnilembus persalinus]|eukprot:KRX09243.1 hypothetical protein PPERSA_05912 [Pseudocohnilembus persalinus]
MEFLMKCEDKQKQKDQQDLNQYSTNQQTIIDKFNKTSQNNKISYDEVSLPNGKKVVEFQIFEEQINQPKNYKFFAYTPSLNQESNNNGYQSKKQFHHQPVQIEINLTNKNEQQKQQQNTSNKSAKVNNFINDNQKQSNKKNSSSNDSKMNSSYKIISKVQKSEQDEDFTPKQQQKQQQYSQQSTKSISITTSPRKINGNDGKYMTNLMQQLNKISIDKSQVNQGASNSFTKYYFENPQYFQTQASQSNSQSIINLQQISSKIPSRNYNSNDQSNFAERQYENMKTTYPAIKTIQNLISDKNNRNHHSLQNPTHRKVASIDLQQLQCFNQQSNKTEENKFSKQKANNLQQLQTSEKNIYQEFRQTFTQINNQSKPGHRKQQSQALPSRNYLQDYDYNYNKQNNRSQSPQQGYSIGNKEVKKDNLTYNVDNSNTQNKQNKNYNFYIIQPKKA